MVVLAQLSLNKHPELPDVPLVMDLAKTDEQRQILKMVFARQVMGRPYLAPPDLPADRVALLRKAFMDTMRDKDFRRRRRQVAARDQSGLGRGRREAGEGSLRNAGGYHRQGQGGGEVDSAPLLRAAKRRRGAGIDAQQRPGRVPPPLRRRMKMPINHTSMKTFPSSTTVG